MLKTPTSHLPNRCVVTFVTILLLCFIAPRHVFGDAMNIAYGKTLAAKARCLFGCWQREWPGKSGGYLGARWRLASR